MTIRTFADIEALAGADKLTEAEQLLLDNCRIGKFTTLGDGERPSGPSAERTIRADLLRYLILGGCDGCVVHESGVKLEGAWIAGRLDLSFATAKGAAGFFNCGFEQRGEALQTRFELLNLTGSALPGLNAQGVRVTGDVFLRGVKSAGKVDLFGAEIGGQLSCEGAELDGVGEYALLAQGLRVTEGVFLRMLGGKGEVRLSGAVIGGVLACEGAELDGAGGLALNAQNVHVSESVSLQGLKSKGEVSFSGAQIGGQLDCEGAELDVGGGKALNAEGVQVAGHVLLRRLTSTGEVRLSGAEIGSQLDCQGAELNGGDGYALNGQRFVVKKGFLWRQVKSVKGFVELNAAHLGDLVDDAESWNKVTAMSLVGLTYDNLVGPLDVEMRKAWLKKGANFVGDFHPQPYQQLAKFFRESGHRSEARDILIEKERRQWEEARQKKKKAFEANFSVPLGTVLNLASRLWHCIYDLFSGYGYKPWRSLFGLGILILFMSFLAQIAWDLGGFAPTSPVILESRDWRQLAVDPLVKNPAKIWSGAIMKGVDGTMSGSISGRDYETFFAPYNSADVVIPLIEFGQTDAWSPSTTRGWAGVITFYTQKILMVLGWVVTALAAGSVTNLIRRDD